MKIQNNLLLLSALSLTMIMSSCGGNDTSTDSLTTVTKTTKEEEKSEFQSEKINSIFFSVPSPMEMATLLKGSGSKYNYKYLNNPGNRDKYTSSFAKAVNLGIYGADLSYASVYNQNQESLLYMSCADQLSDELGVSAAFEGDVMNRVEENMEDRDSLLNIISETYFVLDSYLKENNRSSISAMVISGGWIEGLYIAGRVYEDDDAKSPDLIDRIVDQKYALEDMIALVDSYNTKGDLDGIKADLASLKVLFDKSETISVDKPKPVEGKVVLGSNKKLTMTGDNMDALVNKIKEIREKYVGV